MTELETAIKIAFDATVGQKDHDGGEEILHPLSVMLKGETYQEKIVGVLHDVVEDNDDWTFERLLHEGISEKCVDALMLLTHSDSLSYNQYVDKIVESGNMLAIKVKIHDLEHNISRNKRLDERQETVYQKHTKTLDRIKKKLATDYELRGFNKRGTV